MNYKTHHRPACRLRKNSAASFPFRMHTAVLLLTVALTAGCRVESAKTGSASGSGKAGELSGAIAIDGSSTVLPISKAIAENFMKQHKVQVAIGSTGTGGGFTKFSAGETDINDASRPIKASEAEACKKNGIEFVELKIAIDGLTVAVNPQNDWCKTLTVEQLNKIWEPNSSVKNWNDIDPAWPAQKIQLYGPDTASGTFDFFTGVINGKEGAIRTDYTPSANDNTLVAGVSGDKYSLGYFGYAYYVENQDKLKAVGIAADSNPESAVLPTDETIEAGKYVPLSRPLFLYVSKKALGRPEVAEFVKFYLNEGQPTVRKTKYIPLPEKELQESKDRLKATGI